LPNDNSPANCEVCRTDQRPRFYYNVQSPLYALGHEDPISQVTNFESREIVFAYVGAINEVMDGRMLYSGDFAPLDEMGPNARHAFHLQMENDHNFANAQMLANRRAYEWGADEMAITMDFGNGRVNVSPRQRITDNQRFQYQFNTEVTNLTTGTAPGHTHTYTTNSGTTIDNYTLWYTGEATGNYSTSTPRTWTTSSTTSTWFAETDPIDWANLRLTTPTWQGNDRYEVRKSLFKLFTKVPRIIIKKMNEDEKLMLEAKKKSEALVRSWLSPNELKALFTEGEIKIPSKKDPSVVYIMKRDPNERVIKVKDGKPVEKMCVVAKDLNSPIGDQFLSKFLTLKHDQDDFEQLAIVSPVYA